MSIICTSAGVLFTYCTLEIGPLLSRGVPDTTVEILHLVPLDASFWLISAALWKLNLLLS